MRYGLEERVPSPIKRYRWRLITLKDMESVRRLRIKNKLGLHARAAAKVVELAGRYKSRIFFNKDGLVVDGSNIVSILTLDCPEGSEIEIRIVGEDSEMVMAELIELFDKRFGEKK